jgi:hypothetical protein
MLSCKETTHLLSEAQDRPLAFRERFALGMHLLMCKGCTNYRAQMDFLRQACRQLKTPGTDSRKDSQ